MPYYVCYTTIYQNCEFVGIKKECLNLDVARIFANSLLQNHTPGNKNSTRINICDETGAVYRLSDRNNPIQNNNPLYVGPKPETSPCTVRNPLGLDELPKLSDSKYVKMMSEGITFPSTQESINHKNRLLQISFNLLRLESTLKHLGVFTESTADTYITKFDTRNRI